MIEQYKYISIIYGNTGRKCATYLADRIEKMHREEGYPVKTHLLADEILNSGTILDTIKDLILSSVACIVILTFDDAEGTRVRQNVLIEIGMAASCIERDKCFFISEKVPLPVDFPSDLRSSINPNYFDKDNLEDIFNKLKPVICRQLELKSNRGLLTEKDYEYDYRKLLFDIPEHVLNEPAEIQLDHILQTWTDNIKKYDFVSEKIMYLAERISFFANFKINDLFFQCMKEIESSIKPSKKDFNFYDRIYLREICRLFKSILLYTTEKYKPEVRSSNASLSNRQSEQIYTSFRHISEDIESFVKKYEANPDWNCNRIILILAYDYLALAFMKKLNYSGETSIDEWEYIEDCFKKVVDLAEEDDCSDELWNGYAYYNLARVYENMYRITQDSTYMQKMRKSIEDALYFRHEWLDVDFDGVFGTALTYEYFLASKYDYETRFDIGSGSDGSDDADSIIHGLNGLRKELSEYCEAIDVGRLFELRDSIDFLINTIREVQKDNP